MHGNYGGWRWLNFCWSAYVTAIVNRLLAVYTWWTQQTYQETHHVHRTHTQLTYFEISLKPFTQLVWKPCTLLIALLHLRQSGSMLQPFSHQRNSTVLFPDSWLGEKQCTYSWLLSPKGITWAVYGFFVLCAHALGPLYALHWSFNSC